MGREHFISKRAFHTADDKPGVIVEVNLQKQTVQFRPDDWDDDEPPHWLDLRNIRLMPESQQSSSSPAGDGSDT